MPIDMCFTGWKVATLMFLIVAVFAAGMCSDSDRAQGQQRETSIQQVGASFSASPKGVPRTVQELKGRVSFAGHGDVPCSLALTANGSLVASGSYDKKVIVWDVASGRLLHILEGHTHPISSLAFSADGKILASGTGQYRKAEAPGEVMVWEVATGKQVARMRGHGGFVSSLGFTADGKTLASGSWDRTVKLWDVATGKERASLPTSFVWSVAFTPNGKTLAAGTGVFDRTVPGYISLWDVAISEKRATLKGHHGAVLALACAPDGRTLASGDIIGKVILWDALTGSQQAVVQNPNDSLVRSLSFTADGKILVASVLSASSDVASGRVTSANIARLWELSTGKELATFSGPHKDFGSSTAISADGNTVAWGGFDAERGNGLVKVFELKSSVAPNAGTPSD